MRRSVARFGAASPANTTKRVLVMFGTPLLYGLERAVIDLFDGLRPDIEPVFLITRTASRNNLPVFQLLREKRFRYKQLSDFWSWPRLARPRSLAHLLQVVLSLVVGNIDALRASWGCDAIYLPNRFALCHAALVCAIFRMRGRQVVFEFHDTLSRPSLVLRVFNKIITDVVAGSDFSAARIMETQSFIAQPKISIIRRSAPRATGRSGGPLEPLSTHDNILFVGQVAPHKGVDLLIGAFRAITSDFPNARLHIVGAVDESSAVSPEGTGSGHQDAVHVTYWNYRTDALRFFEHAYVLVQPTRPSLAQETAPLAVVEAMSSGVPSIVTRSGALPEVVLDGVTGLVCKEDSTGCIEALLRSVLMDPQLRDRLGAAARERYESRHAPERVRAQWLQLFGVGARA